MQRFGGRFAMTLGIEETPSLINDWKLGYKQLAMEQVSAESNEKGQQ